MAPDQQVELSANRTKKPWSNSGKYLETHYSLMREDAISSLREAVTAFIRDPDMMDDQKLSIYEKVGLLPQVFHHIYMD